MQTVAAFDFHQAQVAARVRGTPLASWRQIGMYAKRRHIVSGHLRRVEQR